MALSPTLNDVDARERAFQMLIHHGELMMWCDLMELHGQENHLPTSENIRSTLYES